MFRRPRKVDGRLVPSIIAPMHESPHHDTQYIEVPGPKGQLISKRVFGVFNFPQKTNKNKSTGGFMVVK